MPGRPGAARKAGAPKTALAAESSEDIAIRPAAAEDLDALISLEEACFSTDRISRRSFRHLIKAESATVLVAMRSGRLLGDAVLTWRRGVAVARLYSLAVAGHARGQGVGSALLTAVEKAAEAQGAALLRLELHEANTVARRLYERAGYRGIGRIEGYYEDGGAAIRKEKTLRLAPAPIDPPAYYAQTTEFTCGPACLLMAKAHFDPEFTPSPFQEIRFWRRTTTVFMTAGHGGCDPFAMAVALDEAGIGAEVHVSEKGPLFLKTVAREDKRRVMRLAQEDFRAQAAQRRIPVHGAPPSAAALAKRLNKGALAIVLISGNRMLGERFPHWVLAHHADGRHIFIHDPWVEPERNESETDAVNLPIPYAEFDRMARWGASRLRAVVIATGKAKSTTDGTSETPARRRNGGRTA